jgi:hypothetical protein
MAKEINRNKQQQKYVSERFKALGSALAQMDEAEEERVSAAIDLGFQVSFTCSHVLAEFFAAKAEAEEATKQMIQ